MQRLSGLDASFLYFETRSQLLHVCGLITIDVGEMPGGYSFERVRAELERRVAAMPGFRRKLHDSMLNIDHPVWVEAEDFDIDHHMHRMAVPEPGTDEELATLVAQLAGQPMDRSIPLWEMWVIEGLADGGVAVFAKMHHATVDGVTGANMMSQLCTLTPEDPTLEEELVEENAGGSSALELAVGGALSRFLSPMRLLSLLPGTARVLPSWISRARKGLAMPAPFTAPRTPFNRTITGHRSLSFTSLDLDQIKLVKNTFGTTVNDVVLAVCSTALRRYLLDLGVLPKKPLIAMVPMSVHSADERPGTNRVSGMFMPLATEVPDPVERLESIRDANIVAKDHTDALDANLLTDWAQFAAPSVFGSAVRLYSRLRLSERHPVVHNLVISNVPGPNFPLYFLGGRITSMYPMGPVFHGAGVNCTVMSLDGKLHVGFIACKEVLPDPWPLVRAVEDALAEYVEAAEVRQLERAESGEIAEASTPSRGGGARSRKAPARSSAARRKAPAEKAPARRSAARKAPAKKAPAKKAVARSTPARRGASESTAEATPAATKTAAQTTAAKKTTATKSTAQTTAAKKATATKTAAQTTAAKKATATKSTARKTAAKKNTTTTPAAKKSTSADTPAASTPAASSTSGTPAAGKPTGAAPTPSGNGTTRPLPPSSGTSHGSTPNSSTPGDGASAPAATKATATPESTGPRSA